MSANLSRNQCRAPAISEIRSSHRPLLLRLLEWLTKSDQRYRNRQKLRRMPIEQLEDMGITPEQARRIFER